MKKGYPKTDHKKNIHFQVQGPPEQKKVAENLPKGTPRGTQGDPKTVKKISLKGF